MPTSTPPQTLRASDNDAQPVSVMTAGQDAASVRELTQAEEVELARFCGMAGWRIEPMRLKEIGAVAPLKRKNP